MEWYQVTKTIRGRKYLYWQKTFRVGSSVKTLNKYIGPGANPPRAKSHKATIAGLSEPHRKLRTAYDAGKITKTEYLQALAPKPPTTTDHDIRATPALDASPTAPVIPEEAIHQLRPSWANIEPGQDRRTYEKHRARERAEDERVQYGKLKDRVAKHAKLHSAAKRATKGIKSANPFIAQAIKKSKKHGWDAWRQVAKNNREHQRQMREQEKRDYPDAWWRKTKPTTTDRPAAAAFRAAAPFATALDAIRSPEYQALIKENKARAKLYFCARCGTKTDDLDFEAKCASCAHG